MRSGILVGLFVAFASLPGTAQFFSLDPGSSPTNASLFGAQVLFTNSYGYLPNQTTWGWIGLVDDILSDRAMAHVDALGERYDFSRFSKKGSAYLDLRLIGPSPRFCLGEQWLLGWNTQWRVNGALTDIPTALAYYRYEETPVGTPFTITPFSGNIASWILAGPVIGRRFRHGPWEFAVGMGLHYLAIQESGFLQLTQTTEAVKRSNTQLEVGQLNFAYGYTSPLIQEMQLRPTGWGWSVDFDISAQRQWGRGGRTDLTFAIQDAGRMPSLESYELHLLQSERPVILDQASYYGLQQPGDLTALSRILSGQVYGEAGASLQAGNWSLRTPVAAVFQIDHRTRNGWRLAYFQRLALSGLSPEQLYKPQHRVLWIGRWQPSWGYGLWIGQISDRPWLAQLHVRTPIAEIQLPLFDAFIRRGRSRGIQFQFLVRWPATDTAEEPECPH